MSRIPLSSVFRFALFLSVVWIMPVGQPAMADLGPCCTTSQYESHDRHAQEKTLAPKAHAAAYGLRTNGEVAPHPKGGGILFFIDSIACLSIFLIAVLIVRLRLKSRKAMLRAANENSPAEDRHLDKAA